MSLAHTVVDAVLEGDYARDLIRRSAFVTSVMAGHILAQAKVDTDSGYYAKIEQVHTKPPESEAYRPGPNALPGRGMTSDRKSVV